MGKEDRGKPKNAREGTFVGTPLYVAPEMLEFNYSGRFTDFWALGCIVYQFLVGQTPFVAKTANDVFNNILNKNLRFPQDLD